MAYKQDIINKVIELNGTMSQNNIAKTLGISQPTVKSILKRNDIEPVDFTPRTIFFNERYFENIDTEHKAYWLGFIMADACISSHIGKDRKAKSSKRLRINISAKDIELLQKFQEDINISKDCIEVYTPHESTYSDNKMCKLVINSGLMYDDLVKHSITERKTGTECVPDTIPEHLIKHFIRGFLDGDGTIAKRGKNHVTLGFCSSSITILNQLNDIISKQTDLSLKHISKDNSKNMYYLNYTSSYDLVTLYNYLYKESTVHLNRKFAKFSNGLF